MARKKIVFVIVEGPSDEEALGAILSRIYDGNTVYVHIVHGDITSEFCNVPNKNVVTRVGEEVKTYAKSYRFRYSDFREIIHIVDMDGAYVPDTNIIEDSTIKAVMYSPTEIRTSRKKQIEERNKRKSRNLDVLCMRKEIWNIPYRVFYMSCNLDHVLYGEQNCTEEEKEAYSLEFAKRYKDHISDFLTFISKSNFSIVTGYKESWAYIKKDLHSLERHTNLGICFKEASTHENVH